jgi:hypothetical protein
VLIASFFLLLTVGSTLVAFRGVPGQASNGDLSRIELRQQREAAAESEPKLLAAGNLIGKATRDDPDSGGGLGDVFARRASGGSSDPAGEIEASAGGRADPDALRPGVPRTRGGERAPVVDGPGSTPGNGTGVVESSPSPGSGGDAGSGGSPGTGSGSGSAADSGSGGSDGGSDSGSGGTPGDGADSGSGTGSGSGSGTGSGSGSGSGSGAGSGTGTGEGSGSGTGAGGVVGGVGETVEETTGTVGEVVGGVSPPVGETLTETGAALGGLLGGASAVVRGLTGGLAAAD